MPTSSSTRVLNGLRVRAYGTYRRNFSTNKSYKVGSSILSKQSLWVIGASALSAGVLSCYLRRDCVSSCSQLERVRLGDLSDFKDGEMHEVRVHGGRDLVLVTKIKGKFYCTGAKCPHFAASFSDGGCTSEYLICPWHNAKFDVSTGESVNGPCLDAIPTFKVEVDQGSLYAYLPPTPIPDCVDMPTKKCCDKDSRVFVICGGGAAAHTAAETLRLEGFNGRIVIYGDEKHLPYYRPHLSKLIEAKDYDMVASEQALRPMSWYRQNQVEYYGGKRVTGINHGSNTITLDDGNTVKYDKVLVATGSTAASLPFTRGMDNLTNHFTLRTTDDFKRLIPHIKPNTKVVIVGANFIGCEMASSLKATGANITVVTDMPGPMHLIIGSRGSSAIQKLLQKEGINILTNESVKGYTIKNNRVTKIVTANKTIDADIVIEGVGARVNVDMLKCAEVNRDGTVNVDASFRCKGCPDNVFAAGDIVTYPYHVDGSPISVKHWNVALQHGKVAAKNMLGINAKMDMVPFFWSNFFRKGFRFAGVANGVDDIVVEGDVDNYKFLAYYFKGTKAVAMMSMGMDNVGSQMAEAIDKGCVPSIHELKLGVANSQTMLQCLKKYMV